MHRAPDRQRSRQINHDCTWRWSWQLAASSLDVSTIAHQSIRCSAPWPNSRASCQNTRDCSIDSRSRYLELSIYLSWSIV